MAPHPRPQEPLASHQTIIDRLNSLKPVHVSANGKPVNTVTPIHPINHETTNSIMHHETTTSPMLPTNPTDSATNQGPLSLDIKKPLPLPRTIIAGLQHLKPVYVADPIIATKPQTISKNSTDSEVPGKSMTPIHPINEITTYPMQPSNLTDDATNKVSLCPDTEDPLSSQEKIQDCIKSLKRVNGTDPATPTIAKDQVATSEDLNSDTSGNCTNPVFSKIPAPTVMPRITTKPDTVPDDPITETTVFARKFAKIAGKPTVLALLKTPLPPKSSLKPVKKSFPVKLEDATDVKSPEKSKDPKTSVIQVNPSCES